MSALLTQALLASLWQLCLPALLLAAARLTLPARAASARHALAAQALLAQLLLPLTTALGAEPLTAAAAPGAPGPLRWLPVLWASGVGLMLLRLGGGLWRLRSLVRGARELRGEWEARFAAAGRRLGVQRAVRWLESQEISVPMTVGTLRPVVLLPASALSGLPVQSLELLVAHELAHVRRLDYLVNLLQSLVEALYFFHPAVWWVSAKLREEREACCDDLVVARFPDRLAYARALVALEELRSEGHAPALAASGGSLMKRIERLMRSDRRPLAGWPAAAALAVLLLAGAAFAHAPQQRALSIRWLPPALAPYRGAIEAAAGEHGVDADLLALMVLVESAADPKVRSPSGARGLMQLMPGTARRIAEQRRLPYDEARLDEPEYNLDLGAWYLASLFARFDGAPELATAAYNGGPEQVRAWQQGERPLSQETAGYRQLLTQLWSERAEPASQAYHAWRERARARWAAAAESPLAHGTVTLDFGPHTHPIKGGPYTHQGVDLAADLGSAVQSPLDGVVKEVAEDPQRGKVVVVQHRGGLESRYHHLGSVAVQVSQAVRRGATLGTVGTTGETTGPHVHYELRDLGEPIDPSAFLSSR